MSETKKTAGRGRAHKNVWSIPGLEKRVQTLVHEGLLTKKNGEDEIVRVIVAEFAEQLTTDGLNFSKVALGVRVPQMIWTQKIKNDLWNAHRNGMVDTFRATYAYIPAKMVNEEIKSLKGVTHSKTVAEFKAGMGVLNDDELPQDAGKFEFPRISYQKPYVVSEAPEGQMVIVNGALVGIPYPDIRRNTLRRALSDARKRGAAAVVLTNLIDLWTKKTAGFLAVYRAMVSGTHINPDRFPNDYQQEVRDILSGKITDKTIYQTLNERFVEILDGLHKITHRKDNKGPEFPGPVLVQLCLKEEELINAGVYYRLRYMSIVEQNKIQGEFNMARNQLAVAKKDGDIGGMNHWSAEVARLGSRKARVMFTNHTGPEYRRYQRRIRALVVKKLEENIPNCKVISMGSTYLKVHTFVVKTQIPRHDQVTSSYLDAAGSSYGADVSRNTLADVTVICPQCSLDHRDVGREDSKDGQPVTKYITVAPSCLDSEFLREEFRDAIKEAHPVQKLVNSPTFKPGVLVVSWGNGIISTDALPIERLDQYESRNFAYPYPKTKYITWLLDTDNHFGAPDKRYIWDPKERIHLGVTEAMFEMARRLGVVTPSDIRIHCTAEMDDATQGDLWFKQRYRPDPQLMSKSRFTHWLRHLTAQIHRAAEKNDTKAVIQLTDDVSRVVTAQQNFKGEDFPFHQMMEVFDQHLDPQVDVYSAVLGRFVKAGLVIRGISKIEGAMSDTRDLGAVNFPEGNHRIGTLEQADLEGDYMALRLQDKTALRPEWHKYVKEHPDFLRDMIRAPRFGNVTFGWGTIKSPGGFEWGVRVHATPARQSGWSDILDALIKNDLARGDDSYGLGKYVTVTFLGDKHFYAKAETERNIYVMCAAGVHTNTYGSTGGFPPNNTGVCLVSMPADGPQAGPIIVRRLAHDFLRDWFANPTPFNWEKFIPEPV